MPRTRPATDFNAGAVEARTHEQSLWIKSVSLIALNHALVADLCRD